MTEHRPIPELVAHRGFADRYPENTLLAIEAALELGAQWIEFDVQLTADRVPVLLHDSDLRRTGGLDARIFDLSWSELEPIEVNESSRLGNAFVGTTVPRLSAAIELVAAHPRASALIEIKRASLRHFGQAAVLEPVLACLEPLRGRSAIISFDRPILELARSSGWNEIGWVIDAWNDRTRQEARRLDPQFLIVDHVLLPAAPQRLWPGPWRWVVYDILDPQVALDLAARGADLIETMDIAQVLRDPRLSPGQDHD